MNNIKDPRPRFPDEPREQFVTDVLFDVQHELARARAKFPRHNSTHEGYAVLLEEVDELWEAIRHNESSDRLRAEAIQVAAMAVRFVLDVCDPPKRT